MGHGDLICPSSALWALFFPSNEIKGLDVLVPCMASAVGSLAVMIYPRSDFRNAPSSAFLGHELGVLARAHHKITTMHKAP